MLRIEVAHGRRDEAWKTIRPLLGPTRVRAGCMSCHLYRDVEDPDVLTLVEEWQSQEDLDRHIRSDDYRRILAWIELSRRSPEVRFIGVSKVAGLELVEAVRLAGQHSSNGLDQSRDL